MDSSNVINLESLSLLDKAELADKLLRDVITEMKTNEFADKSDNHKRIRGLTRTFSDMFLGSTRSIVEYLKDLEVHNGI